MNKDDTISREAALACFHDWIDKHGDVHTPDEMEEYLAIEGLPSVQPEPCEYTVSAVAVEEMLKDLLPKRGIWEIDGDEAKTAVCETVHDALEGLWRLPWVKPNSNGSSLTQEALDTISRQAAIDAINNIMPTKEGFLEPSEVLCELTQLSSAQPSLNQGQSRFNQGQSSDCISRQDAMDALAKFVPYAIYDDSTESYTNGLKDAYNLICQLPSAQPEIVRCKDCKYWVAHDKRCAYLNHGFAPNMWCCHGEKREDG